jgi:hypothetical protein
VRHRPFRTRGSIAALGDDSFRKIDCQTRPAHTVNIPLNILIQTEIPQERVFNGGAL